jgi:ankyrin repeat protein
MGSDLDIQDKYGFTCSHMAVKYNNQKISKFLSKNGSNLNIKNNDGDTPKQLAKKLGFEDFF